MRKFFSMLIIIFVSFGIMISDAEAKRFGGGRSFGVQRSASSFSRPQPSMSQMPRPASTASKWLGPLAGLAAGGLLASLMMGHGLGTGMLSWLAIAGVGLLLWSLFRNKFQMASQPRQYNQYQENVVHDARSQFTPNNQAYSAAPQSPSAPVGFDTSAFLRDAKVQFIRLQAAYDAKNLIDLREFTAPEVFAEIQMQLQERGSDVNHTEVVSLEAEMLEVETEINSLFATVQFTGMIRETANEAAVPFKELWHFRKGNNQFNWVIVGIQQVTH
jgi:predicted lipid-binding transport protein (Tim44 family)